MAYEGHEVRSGEIVIEIDEEVHNVYTDQVPDMRDPTNAMLMRSQKRTVVSGNGHRHFEPVGRAIRGRIVFARFGSSFDLDRATREFEGVPGERIHIDLENRVGRITDALFDPANEELLMQAQTAAMKMQMPFVIGPGYDGRGKEPQEVKLLDEYSYWGWIYAMRQIVDAGCGTKGPRACRPVQNIDLLPSLEKCIRSCRVPIKFSEGWISQWLSKEQKDRDPDFREGGRPVLTPALMGLREQEEELAGV